MTRATGRQGAAERGDAQRVRRAAPPGHAHRPRAEGRARGDGFPYPRAIRRVELPIGGHVWVVPLSDTSDRVVPSEACIRTLPRRLRGEVRRRKRRDRRRPAIEGLEILPYDAEGVSRGNSTGSPIAAVREDGLEHVDAGATHRTTRATGLVPDGVVRVRVVIPAFRDEHRRAQPQRESVVDVHGNVYAVELPSPFDFMTPEPLITWLDQAGTTVGPNYAVLR